MSQSTIENNENDEKENLKLLDEIVAINMNSNTPEEFADGVKQNVKTKKVKNILIDRLDRFTNLDKETKEQLNNINPNYLKNY
jgi:hypothetical protein